MKPGWKTSEFYVTLATQVLALLVILGLITPSESQQLGEAIAKSLAAVGTLCVNLLVVVNYIEGRVKMKELHALSGTANDDPKPLKLLREDEES